MLHARTWADVDLNAVTLNVDVLRRSLGPDIALLPVTKADAYGHGAIPLAWHLTRLGIYGLGVGDSTEALELRATGITSPILILGAIVRGELDDVLRGGIQVTVHAEDRVEALRDQARRSDSTVDVHLKVDTGMGRLGCQPSRAVAIARSVHSAPQVHLVGVATHLADAREDGGESALRQMRQFSSVCQELGEAGLLPPWRHTFASGAVMSALHPECNLVRPGLSVYGVAPHRSQQEHSLLTPALAWRTQIVFLKDHEPGTEIGYGGTWTAARPSRIATLPVGYNDGYRFAFSNRADVLIRGRRAPVVGRVSMDYICIDVTDVPGAGVGDVVTLLGCDSKDSISVWELADLADTIPYEILCGIGRRVKRRYAGGANIDFQAQV